MVIIEVRNDKDRGNLVMTIRQRGNVNSSFFKYHHQPINQHPEQIQRIVQLSKPTTRIKLIEVEIVQFVSEYWNMSGKFFEFKGVKLNSTDQQVSKVQDRLINKEIGALKRAKTIQDTKGIKKHEKNRQIREKLASDEAQFQIKRAERITATHRDVTMQNE